MDGQVQKTAVQQRVGQQLPRLEAEVEKLQSEPVEQRGLPQREGGADEAGDEQSADCRGEVHVEVNQANRRSAKRIFCSFPATTCARSAQVSPTAPGMACSIGRVVRGLVT